MTDAPSPAADARRLMRAAGRASLATAQQGWPYAALTPVALAQDGSPLLLLSNLAEHTKNLRRDPRASLLFDGTAGREDPLTGPRVSLLGEVAEAADPPLLARFLRRHPSAERYAGFSDFRLYRMKMSRAHLVAGFGRDRLDRGASAAVAAGPGARSGGGGHPGAYQHRPRGRHRSLCRAPAGA